jgi:predicted nucleic acid-binding protein
MLIADTNIAFKLIANEVDSDKAEVLVVSAASRGDRLFAPPLIRYEITNIIIKYLRRNRLPLASANALWSAFERLPIQVLPIELSAHALEIALGYNLPAAYDAHYLALAARLGCDFWTADERLVNALAGALPGVRWLGSIATR